MILRYRLKKQLYRLADHLAQFVYHAIQMGRRLPAAAPATFGGWLAAYTAAAAAGLLVPSLSVGVVWLALFTLFALVDLAVPTTNGGRPVRPELVFWWYTLVGAALVGVPGLVELGGLPTQVGPLYLDDLGRSLLGLTGLVFPVVALMSYRSILVDRAAYFAGMVLIEFGLVVCFASSNLLIFYIAFEALAFPMFIQIGRYGSNAHARRRAAFKFFIYTLLGSTTALPGILLVYTLVGSLEVVDLLSHPFTPSEQLALTACFSLPFFVKIPVVPLHLWLVEAHVEAPAASSMVLAGLLLKTGGYGYLRWVSSVYPEGSSQLSWLTLTAAAVGVVAASLFALIQTDMKRMMAYSSVGHMGVMSVGLIVNTPLSNQGAVYTMLAHGFASTGLFAGVGALYDRYHTRDIRGFGGLAEGAPLLSCLFFFLVLANFGFPFTGNFVGEFATLGEVVRVNLVVGVILGVASFVSLVYSMWLYNRVFFGQTNPRVARVEDLYPAEVAALTLCCLGVGLLGFTGGAYCDITSECYHYLARLPTSKW